MSLQPLEDALAALLAAVPSPRPLEIEHRALPDALGQVLASEQRARIDVPPADNSAMDGYAVRAADAGLVLPVVQRIAAGDTPVEHLRKTAARIFTGAWLPPGADAVVMQEDCRRVPGGSEDDAPAGRVDEYVQLPVTITTGQHVRSRGQDTAAGDLLMEAGRCLRAQDLGLLAAQGIDGVPVYRPLRVALLSTGSELREPGSGPLPTGAIYNSNRPMLAALLSQAGCEVLDLGIVADSAEATGAALERAAQGADVVLSSGGVSVGEADHVREQVALRGAIDLWRIAIKPGKPFAFGRVGDTPFLGLPGNPASAFVTFLLLARPYLLAMRGVTDVTPWSVPVRAAFSIDQPGTRTEFMRARLAMREGESWAEPYANQSSGVLRSLCDSDALVRVERGTTVSPGDRLTALPLAQFL